MDMSISQTKLEIRGRAQREVARRRNGWPHNALQYH